jgi:transmembrane sensor
MISREEFLFLYKKYLEGLCTPEEIELIDQYQDDIELTNTGWDDENKHKQEVKARIWQRLGESRGVVANTQNYKIKRFTVLKIAAVLLLALSVSLFVIYRPSVHDSSASITKNNNTHILPGSNKAILIMADGSKIILTDAKNGRLAAHNGIQISKAKDGMLVYHFAGAKGDNKTKPGELNTITTPKGGQYQLVLSDGTKVWLNAMSSLSFPVAFTGVTRDVRLTGEAYFEVAKNKDKPFIVKANGTNVQVLGTHFNVSAYIDDPAVTTTLLEGSVRLVKESSVAMLTPGEQGTSVNSQTQINVKAVDVDKVMAWKNGYLLFDNTDIHTIMKQAARWYDVDVVYQGQLDEKTYGGKISKYKDITELLKNLELTGTIHFKVEGRRVTVMQ